MANYVFYQVHLMENQQKNMHLQHLDGTSILEHAQEHFGSYFKGKKLDLYKTNKQGEITRHPNDILMQVGDVTLLRINNVQMKSIYQKVERPDGGIPDYKEEKLESNPFSYVVIDNRPGICQIAIEKSSTWGSSTDAVRDLLEEWFKEQLFNDYGLDLTIDLKWQETEFWEYVEQRFKDSGDVITQVKFDMLNPVRIKPYNQPQAPLSGFVKAMSDATRLMDMLKSTIIMEADGTGRISQDKKYEDIAQMVRLCSTNSYHLSVTFRDYGEYKCNDMVKAMYDLSDEAFNDFLHGAPRLSETNPEGEYELIRWLDYVLEKTQMFNDGNKVRRKAKGKRKK